MTQANLQNTKGIGEGLDHPESVFVDPTGRVYCGGEAGQVYVIDPGGAQHVPGTTGGSILGLVVDADGGVHCCDCKHKGVFLVKPDGEVRCRSRGTPERPMELPGHPAFHPDGRLFMSDSGDYYEPSGALYVIEPDDTTSVFHHGPFHFANGIALHPSGKWLYVAQSTRWNIVRVPLDEPHGPIEIVFQMPDYTIVDGMWFSLDGRLFVGCYRPDQVLCCHPDGHVELVMEDRTAELLSAPTNVFPHNGQLYVSNLGGQHITVIEHAGVQAAVHQPALGY